MRKTVITTCFILTSHGAFAGEIWQGKGKLYDAQLNALSDYFLKVEVKKVSQDEDKIEITIRSAEDDMVIEHDYCTMMRQGAGWVKTCDGGTSHGKMLSFGLGIDYYVTKNGKAYATQISYDTPTKMRLFRTELEGGVAKHFFAEELVRE